MRVDSARLSAAIQDIYSAVLEGDERARLPHRIAAGFYATSCIIQTREQCLEGRVSFLVGTENINALVPRYVAYDYRRDLWVARASHLMDRAVLSEDLVPERELVASDCYHGHLLSARSASPRRGGIRS